MATVSSTHVVDLLAAAVSAVASSASSRAVAAVMAASLLCVAIAGAGGTESEGREDVESEVVERLGAIRPVLEARVQGKGCASLPGSARARHNVAEHALLRQGVGALRAALARPQRAQRGSGFCAQPEEPEEPVETEAEESEEARPGQFFIGEETRPIGVQAPDTIDRAEVKIQDPGGVDEVGSGKAPDSYDHVNSKVQDSRDAVGVNSGNVDGDSPGEASGSIDHDNGKARDPGKRRRHREKEQRKKHQRQRERGKELLKAQLLKCEKDRRKAGKEVDEFFVRFREELEADDKKGKKAKEVKKGREVKKDNK